MSVADLHFLRPLWLLALVPAALLAVLAWRGVRTGTNDWARVVDAHLLPHLMVAGDRRAARWPVLLLLAGWVAAILAVAGPTRERLPAPGPEPREPVVVVLAITPSMTATDQNPNRMDAARFKVTDLIERLSGGEVGLVAYADVPFVASPLTVDLKTLGRMVPGLDPAYVRALSARPDLALDKAVALLKGGGGRRGRIILFTDGPGDLPQKTIASAGAAADAGYAVSIVGVGAGAGAGSDAAAPSVAAQLSAIAAAGKGAFTPVTVDGRDLDLLLGGHPAGFGGPGGSMPAAQASDAWIDLGPFVLLFAVLLAPLAFRRGWIVTLLIALQPVLAPAPRAEAGPLDLVQSWDDLWARPDQQGAGAFARQDYAKAAQAFDDPGWKAAALYKSGDYEGAAAAYGAIPGADYNRANALARAGHWDEAITAYDKALAEDPGNAQARNNRDIVQKAIDLLKANEPPKPPESGGGGKPKDDGDTPSGGGKDEQKEDQPPAAADAQPPAPERPLPKPAPLPPRRPPELARAKPPAEPPPPPPSPVPPPAPAAPAPPPTTAETAPAPPPKPTPGRGQRETYGTLGQVEQPKAIPLKDDPAQREQLLQTLPDQPGIFLSQRIGRHYFRGPVGTEQGN